MKNWFKKYLLEEKIPDPLEGWRVIDWVDDKCMVVKGEGALDGKGRVWWVLDSKIKRCVLDSTRAYELCAIANRFTYPERY